MVHPDCSPLLVFSVCFWLAQNCIWTLNDVYQNVIFHEFGVVRLRTGFSWIIPIHAINVTTQTLTRWRHCRTATSIEIIMLLLPYFSLYCCHFKRRFWVISSNQMAKQYYLAIIWHCNKTKFASVWECVCEWAQRERESRKNRNNNELALGHMMWIKVYILFDFYSIFYEMYQPYSAHCYGIYIIIVCE